MADEPADGGTAAQPASHPRDRQPPRILVYAYQLKPGVGSEPGAAWALAPILASFGPCSILTRTHPRSPGYANWLSQLSTTHAIEVVHVPIPNWDRIWLRRPRPWITTVVPQLEYLVWQLFALRAARQLVSTGSYDLVWHLGWANGWVGSTASLLDRPFVYGPVGAGLPPPWRLVPTLGLRGMAMELLRSGGSLAARWLNPLARLSWNRARLILAQNPATVAWFPKSARGRIRVFHNAVVPDDVQPRGGRHGSTPPTAFFVGRLVPWKGAHLAIEAIARQPGWRLAVCGDGPDRARLERLVGRRGMAERVSFLGHLPREKIVELLCREADVLLFPSLRDHAGLAVVEAMAAGVPVVCLDHGGPAVLTGAGVPVGSFEETVARLAAALPAAVAAGPPDIFHLTPTARRRHLAALLREAGLLTDDGAG